MKHPVWILNISLLILVLFAIGFAFFSVQKIPSRYDIEPSTSIRPLRGEVAKVNISKIYENDLFGTYRTELPTYMPSAVPPIPEPPQMKKLNIPVPPAPQFLDPLAITLKGIIVMLQDDSLNRAIIMDNKTNRENSYRIGQMIEDAQVIQILNNKVILLRANGQQEVLYLREKDAQMDPTYLSIDNWNDVVQKISDTEFYVSPREFVKRIKNLSSFIDMLDLITVYRQGHSIGCRVGNIATRSIGRELGLQTGDIILTVNDIPAVETSQRFKIYKQIIAMQKNDSIRVKLLRQGQEIELIYILKNLTKEKTGEGTPAQMSAEDIRKEQMRILQEKHKFAPTLDQIKEREKAAMFEKGKAPASKSQQKTAPIKTE